MQTERLETSVSMLAQRVELVAGEVARALSAPLGAFDEFATCARWITTGAGASEGPARLLASLLRAEGIAADFAPISSFVIDAPAADASVIVSQRLSPNARVPLSRARGKTMIVTTVDDAGGARVVQHGPADEDGLLLRVVGPAAAYATVMRLAKEITRAKRGGARAEDRGLTETARVSETLASARARSAHAIAGESLGPEALFDVAGFVAVGADVAWCDGLRHKFLEGLGLARPLWDLCNLVHGPLQSFFERDAVLMLLERDGHSADLSERLARVLSPARHRVIRIRSSLAGPLALLDFDLQLDHLVLDALRARPRDLVDWPGKGCDAPLYDLGI